MTERLDKIISSGFLISRTDAKKAIRQGRVTVDGVTADDCAAKVCRQNTDVRLDGAAPPFGEHIYLMMNKPAGYLSATEDRHSPTVMDLLTEELARADLGVAGRLDKDSEGMLLLMNDGALNHRLTSPRHHAQKLYAVTLDIPADESDRDAFARGIALQDFVCAPAMLEIDACDGRNCHVTLEEGKFHQVKRMFAARSKQVQRLQRISIAGLALDETLEPGQYRPLREAEIDFLFGQAGILTKM